MMKYSIKIILINLLIALLFVTLIELIFGYWFDKDNFGPYLREHRLKKNPVVLNYGNETYNFIYKRNYHAFRGNEIDPSKIKAVIVGGSTTEERYKPHKLTITGNLNSLLKDRNYDFEIINAGILGQSTIGHIYNFKYWFPKLKGFSPKLYIFYIGINDLVLDEEKFINNNFGDIKSIKKLEAFFDNLKNRSFFVERITILKQKYYLTDKKMKYDHNYFHGKDISNYKYINYEKALEIHDINYLKSKYQKKIKNYLHRIESLNKHAINKSALPIFINQVMYDGLKNEILFIINYSLIEYCKKKKIACIDLAMKFDGKLEYWFDEIHTTGLGSKIIANTIIDELVEIIDNET